jgi:hypothetical protein
MIGGIMTHGGSWSRYFRRGVSRRNLVHGTIAAGTVLGAGLWTPARADDGGDDGEGEGRCGQPLPIPYTHPTPTGGPIHHYQPGPINGAAAATDLFGTHPEGRDPSLITNFAGVVGEVDLIFSGTGMDTKTGAKATYTFHTDTRFMSGQFMGSDEQLHKGSFAFI